MTSLVFIRAQLEPITAEWEVPFDGGDRMTAMLGHTLCADRSKPRVAEREWREAVDSIARGDQFALRALYERTHRLVFT